MKPFIDLFIIYTSVKSGLGHSYITDHSYFYTFPVKLEGDPLTLSIAF